MPRKPRWYDAIPPATALVDCGGQHHRVTWRWGKLVLEDHDLTAERTMLAFGGEMCPCMRVLEMWVEQFRMPVELAEHMPKWLGEHAFLAPPEFDLARSMAMFVSWERLWKFTSWLPSKQATLLSAEIKARALPPLREYLNAWKARTGARVVAACQAVLLPSNQPSTIDGTTDRVAMRAVAHLHARWLVDIWPRDLAVVDDAFVLDLAEAVSADDLHVRAVRWESKGPGRWATVAARAWLHREPGAGQPWHLTWEDA